MEVYGRNARKFTLTSKEEARLRTRVRTRFGIFDCDASCRYCKWPANFEVHWSPASDIECQVASIVLAEHEERVHASEFRRTRGPTCPRSS